MKHVVQLVTLVIEPRAPNFSAVVQEIGTKKLPLPILIAPRLYVPFMRTPSFNSPLVRVWRYGFDGQYVAVGRGVDAPSPVHPGR